jgi:hypothetical protein
VRLEDLSWFDAAVIGVTVGCAALLVVLIVAQEIRSAYRWRLLRKACGGDDAALRVLLAMQGARAMREAPTHMPSRRPSKPRLHLVKS